ncbi:MAG TPA: hypothetical protein VGQ09_12880 [Chitinophagaceae bacterium]|jgi:hypothetical protein|nr:hypothetical protein [Chitinophagaceae bacterium]
MNFFKINFKSRFWKSSGNIALLLVFTFLPLIVNIIIAAIPSGDRKAAMAEKIVPGEVLAYCLSLIAPLFIFLLKTHGNSFKIPALKPMFIISFIVYFLSLILTLIAKNGLIAGIDLKSGHKDLYFWLSISFLLCAILLRLYTDYQDGRFSDYKQQIDKQQQNFNDLFRNSIK